MKKEGARGRKGDGSVFEAKPGKWCASISIGSGAARRKIRKFAASKPAAEEALRRLRSEHAALTPRAGETPTLERAIAHWLTAQKPRIRSKSYVDYEGTLRLHVVEAMPVLAAMRVDRIRPAHIRELLAHLETSGRSIAGKPRTARVRELVFLRLHSVFESYVGDAIVRNPVQRSHRPRVERKTMQTWTQAQARAFLEATRDDELAALYRLALSVGMRRGELLGLRWSDVDLKNKRIHVQHTLSEDGKTLGQTKTAGSRRSIELPSRAAEGLRAQKAALLERGLRASPWVFPTAAGSGFPARKLTDRFKSAIEATNAADDRPEADRRESLVPVIRFHDLRHTAATIRLQLGDHPKVVSEMLGHASIAITLDLYSHTIPSLQRDSADRVDAAL